MRRTVLAAFPLALCLSGAVAKAQYDSDLERPPIPNPNAEGRPRTFHPGAPLSNYIWHDGSGWHLRSTTSGHYHNFAGNIQAPEGVYNVHTTDPGVGIQISGNVISFNYQAQGGERGIDWAGSGPMNFNLTIDGRDRSEKTRIGFAEERPNPGGIQLYPGGGMAAAPPMAEPAGDDVYNDMQSVDGPEMDPDAFQSVLSPYGSWADVDGYGTVWQPNPAVVGANFSPYSYGHWAYTDLGWTWVSGYDWGWAPFHYGNWIWANNGWGWVPGRVWAPAWVTWRHGGGYVGWAPVAPYGHEMVYPPERYAFVTVGGFNGGGNIRETIVTGREAVVIHGRTDQCASATYVGGRWEVPRNVGPSPHVIAQESGRPVTPVAARSLNEHIGPPAGTRGVHNAGTFGARPMSAEARQGFVKAQPQTAQQSFHQSLQAQRAAPMQVGHPLQPAAAAHVNDQVRRAPAPSAAARGSNERGPVSNEHPAPTTYRPPAEGARGGEPEGRPAEGRPAEPMEEGRPQETAHPGQMQQKKPPPQQPQQGGAKYNTSNNKKH